MKKEMWQLCQIRQGPEIIIHNGDWVGYFQTADGVNYSSVGGSYDSLEELRAGQQIQEHPCKCCGGLISKPTVRMKTMMLCFSCDFWHNRIEEYKKSDPNLCIINGTQYQVLKETGDDRRFNGFAGRKFCIEKDGKQIITTNLWFCGDIPERFRSQMPDNAKFIKL
jgi:hypothetical protein